ncbi:MAG: hypothetical protein Q4D38_00270 [Planctomycetia bacterium]|nr:hypothetical protein [Planctomycetia bacterium]
MKRFFMTLLLISCLAVATVPCAYYMEVVILEYNNEIVDRGSICPIRLLKRLIGIPSIEPEECDVNTVIQEQWAASYYKS